MEKNDLLVQVERTIRRQAKIKGLTLQEFSRRIGMTEPGIHKMFKLQSIKVTMLKKIADEFNLPVTYFFEDGQQRKDPETEFLRSKVQLIEDMLPCQAEIIRRLENAEK